MRILIVDDEELSLDILRMSLEGAGHEVASARSGAEAMSLLESDERNVVISDWEMAGMNGLELCRRVRSQGSGSYTYFILLTARERSASIVEGLAAGADDFINKPFDPEELAGRLRVAERILSLETRDMTIFSLAKLAESRDPETGHHLERVQNYSWLLG